MIQTLRLGKYLLILCIILICSWRNAQSEEVLRTSYSEIHYDSFLTLNEFLWRLTGKRYIFPAEKGLACSRVDRIIVRVRSILDMHPEDDKLVNIELYPAYEKGMVASFDADKKIVTVYADKITDGIFAHEIAHAVMDIYFDLPLPRKTQEILAQYVDRHLWEDY